MKNEWWNDFWASEASDLTEQIWRAKQARWVNEACEARSADDFRARAASSTEQIFKKSHGTNFLSFLKKKFFEPLFQDLDFDQVAPLAPFIDQSIWERDKL